MVDTYLDDLRPATLFAWFRRPRRAKAQDVVTGRVAPGVEGSEA